MERTLTISAIARRSGVKASALRFYEEKGLIASERSASGYRRYPRTTLRRVAFIVFAQRVGLSLKEIAGELAKLPLDRTPTKEDWSKLTERWLARIDERIIELQKMRADLTYCIGCGCLSFDACQFANPDDRVAASGPGPRFWM